MKNKKFVDVLLDRSIKESIKKLGIEGTLETINSISNVLYRTHLRDKVKELTGI